MPPVSTVIDKSIDGEPSSTRETVLTRSEPEVKSNVFRKYASLQTPALMALNFCSAVGIVVVNKALFRHSEGLGFATSLTGLHFAFTALGVRLCRVIGLYKIKPLKQTQVVLPFKLLMTLVPICAGVALSNASDTDASAEGAFWALAGLLAAAGYQVLVKSTQEKLQVSSLQLLHHQAPQAAVLVLVSSPFFDDTRELLAMATRSCSMAVPSRLLRLSPLPEVGEAVEVVAAAAGATAGTTAASREAASFFWAGAVLVSCLLAFLVNLSTFLVIGRTSPVSYQVLGHFKLLIILLVGVAGFGEVTSPARFAGMLLAFAGIVGYTTLRQGLGSGWERRENGGGAAGCGGSGGSGGSGSGSGSGGGVRAITSGGKKNERGGADAGKAIRRTR